MHASQKNTVSSIDQIEMLRIPANEISDPESIVSSPKVSVILMTRNHEAYLEQAVRSILDQVCAFRFEILIGEDFSTDGTRKICLDLQQQHPDRIRLVVADQNVGITPNFLRLVARCRGQYIALLEGDDYWTRPDKLGIQVKLMDDHPEYAWCGARTGNRTFCVPVKKCYSLIDTLRRYIVHTSTVLFRAELLISYPRFPDMVGWISMVYAYLASKGDCGFIDEEMSYYRHHVGGVWNGSDFRERIRLSRKFSRVMNEYFHDMYRTELADRELWIYRLQLDALLSAWRVADWFQLLRFLPSQVARCFFLQPISATFIVCFVLGAPLTAAMQFVRRKAAIRTRIGKLLDKVGR